MLYKRAASLIASWQAGRAVAHNYIARASVPLTSDALTVLNALGEWRSRDSLHKTCAELPHATVDAVLDAMVQANAVETDSASTLELEARFEGWRDWGHPATAFHFQTKDVEFDKRATMHASLDIRLEVLPPPPPVTGVGAIPLPSYSRDGEFVTTLLQRRTWRRFGAAAVRLDELSALLGLTFGVQHQLWLSPTVAMPMKTSPSGGSCHVIEAYVVARRVDGLAEGTFVYRADSHALDLVGPPWSDAEVESMLGGQAWTSRAPVLVLMSAVLPRVQWKYRSGRALRIVLLEAGHVCQTFCLTATWLGLAPFCSAALADTAIERALKMDGITETLIYAAGVGRRPNETDWAPWPESAETPPRTPVQEAMCR